MVVPLSTQMAIHRPMQYSIVFMLLTPTHFLGLQAQMVMELWRIRHAMFNPAIVLLHLVVQKLDKELMHQQ